MGASFEESVIALKSMFPDVSEVVVRTTLEARDGHMESAVEKLLAMSRRGGGGHGGKDYGQSGLGAPGAMGMSPSAYDGRNGCVRRYLWVGARENRIIRKARLESARDACEDARASDDDANVFSRRTRASSRTRSRTRGARVRSNARGDRGRSDTCRVVWCLRRTGRDD